jgi:hypothetical protein
MPGTLCMECLHTGVWGDFLPVYGVSSQRYEVAHQGQNRIFMALQKHIKKSAG